MAKLTRQAQQIFAGQAPSDMIAAFGSTQTGTPVYSTDLSTLQTTNYQQGWQDAIIADKAPFLEEMNGVQYGLSYQIAYAQQMGIPEWLSTQDYYTGSRCIASDYNVYKSLTDDNTGNNPVVDDGTNWVIDGASGAGMPVGTIFAHTCSASFVPENSLPCDGTEYTQAQFQTFYNDWLVGARLNTCTYKEQEQEIATYGKCAKIALDTVNQKFKVPYIPDGTVIQQAMTNEELGESYNAGLPNITGTFDSDGAYPPTGAFEKVNGHAYSGGDNAGIVVDFSASRSNPIYGNSDTVQPDAVSLRFFIVVATGSINQSEMDWSEWASSLASKANIDANNFTSTGKAEITSWGIPDYSAGVTQTLETVYAAQFDCLVVVTTDAKSVLGSAGIYLYNSNEEQLFFVSNMSPTTGNSTSSILLPVPKGYKYKGVANAGITTMLMYPLKGVSQ